jgi:hypothetical protein
VNSNESFNENQIAPLKFTGEAEKIQGKVCFLFTHKTNEDKKKDPDAIGIFL